MGKYTCDGNFNTFKLLFKTKSDATIDSADLRAIYNFCVENKLCN